jgi:hypothetical protein
MIERRVGAAVCAAVAALAGCADVDPVEPAIASIAPNAVTPDVATEATIWGEGFLAQAAARLDEGGAPELDYAFRVRLGAVEVAATDVAFVDAGRIDIVVPAGLALGSHDVAVTTPRGLTATLSNALTVREVVECTDASGCADPCRSANRCEMGMCVLGAVDKDDDDDTFIDAACGGNDCDDDDDEVNPNGVEGPEGSPSCADTLDNDCDGATDGEDLDCGGDAPFGDPDLVDELSDTGANDRHPSLTDDLREIYFSSDRAGGAGATDIWMASRDDPGDPWDAPVVVAELNSSSSEEHPEISADGRTIYFASNRPGGFGNRDIYSSTRADRDEPWETPVQVPELSTGSRDLAPAQNAAGLAMVLQNDSKGSGDLLLTVRASTSDPWGAPNPIDELNTSSVENGPFLRAGDLVIYFDSRRTGGGDLFVATRDADTDPFDSALPLGNLNTIALEESPWLDPTRTIIYFSSNRSGNNEIYRAQR